MPEVKGDTVMSVVKRRQNEALIARMDQTQRVPALLRGLIYNLQRLVRLGAPVEPCDRARRSKFLRKSICAASRSWRYGQI
jgi:hypothetical protein